MKKATDRDQLADRERGRARKALVQIRNGQVGGCGHTLGSVTGREDGVGDALSD